MRRSLVFGSVFLLMAVSCGGPTAVPSTAPVTVPTLSPDTSPRAPTTPRVTATVATGGGPSCEQVKNEYVEHSSPNDPPDLSAGRYGAVLNRGTYLAACNVPHTSSVTVCAAVIDGVATGVSVEVDPPDQTAAECVAEAIRAMAFPSHPKLDITTTRFKAADS